MVILQVVCTFIFQRIIFLLQNGNVKIVESLAFEKSRACSIYFKQYIYKAYDFDSCIIISNGCGGWVRAH